MVCPSSQNSLPSLRFPSPGGFPKENKDLPSPKAQVYTNESTQPPRLHKMVYHQGVDFPVRSGPRGTDSPSQPLPHSSSSPPPHHPASSFVDGEQLCQKPLTALGQLVSPLPTHPTPPIPGPHLSLPTHPSFLPPDPSITHSHQHDHLSAGLVDKAIVARGWVPRVLWGEGESGGG